jgi:hypothetical protein
MAVGRELSLKNMQWSKVKSLSGDGSRKMLIMRPLSVKPDMSRLWAAHVRR